MKKVLIINANPKTDSLTKSMAHVFAAVAMQQHEVIVTDIGDLVFDLDLQQGYDGIQELEMDLVTMQKRILWAEHIVILSPVWWGSFPAKFKGLIDRAFLPDFAFKYQPGKTIPKKLLAGKTSEIIINLDTPVFWYKFVQGNVIYKHLKRTILDFSGIKNRRSHYFGPVMSASPKDIKKWQQKIRKLASTI